MVLWTGFANLIFGGSAGLALARALDLAETDAFDRNPEAWVVEDRRISLSIRAETPRAMLEGTRRLLEALVAEALDGEAAVEVLGGNAPVERWEGRATPPTVSGAIPTSKGAESGPVSAEEYLASETIPSEAEAEAS